MRFPCLRLVLDILKGLSLFLVYVQKFPLLFLDCVEVSLDFAPAYD